MNNPFKTEKVYAGPEPIESKNESKTDGVQKLMQPYPISNADASNERFKAVYAGPDMGDLVKLQEMQKNNPIMGFNGDSSGKGMASITRSMPQPVKEDLGLCPNCGEKREYPGKFCAFCGFSFKKNE